jgi:transposase-like protein
VHAWIITLRSSGHSIAQTAKLAGCSASQVKRVWALAQKQKTTLPQSA